MYTPPGFLIAERVNGEDNYGLKGGVFVTTDGVDTETLFALLDKDSAAELAAIMAVHDYKSGPTAAIGVPGPLRLPVSGPILGYRCYMQLHRIGIFINVASTSECNTSYSYSIASASLRHIHRLMYPTFIAIFTIIVMIANPSQLVVRRRNFVCANTSYYLLQKPEPQH